MGTRMRAVGIGGKDLAEGHPKLTLAVVWQLMRADVLQFLATLDMNEKDILKWANRRVRGTGSLLQISSFKDLTLRNGVFILQARMCSRSPARRHASHPPAPALAPTHLPPQLLRAIAEECVDAAEILPGGTAEECKLNAKYAISCAHKMGCTVFLVWEARGDRAGGRARCP